MKRILPVVILVCVIGAVFCCLPSNEKEQLRLTSLEDLNQCDVAIQTGLNYDIFLKEVCPDANPVFFSEFPSMFPAVEQGKVDAMLTESTSFPVERLEHPSFVALEESIKSIGVSIGVSKTALGTTVLQQLNEFIQAYSADGTYDSMFSYWFTDYDRGNTGVDKSGLTGENGVVVFTAEASYEPMCFAGDGGELQGFDVDFIYRFCRAYGYEPEIIPLEFDAMSAALASQRATVAMGLVADDERAEEILFSDSYLYYDIIATYDAGSVETTSFWEHLINSFEKTFIRENRWQMFLQGTGITILISFLSVVFGTVLGLLLYLWCSHGKKAEQTVTDILCWLFGSTPTVVLLMILYYILFGNYQISNISVSVIGFSFLFGCEFYENIDAGVKAVGTGQEEAARAQGFSQDQAFFRIILPQAKEHFFPAYQGDIISLIQETSVVGYIAVMDLTKMSDLVRGRTYDAFFPLLATAGIYFLIIFVMTALLKTISRKTNNKNRKKEKILRGINRAGKP